MGVTLPPLSKVEYSGSDLEVSKDYKIKQGVSETIFIISSPHDEIVLLNIYKIDGTLIGTLYQGERWGLYDKFSNNSIKI